MYRLVLCLSGLLLIAIASLLPTFPPTPPSIHRPQVRGPARSAKEARKQQQKYAAAKEARSMLGGWHACGGLCWVAALADSLCHAQKGVAW